MDILTRRFRNVIQDFSIYTQKEADDKGIEYVPWRECEKGNWVLSDDGYVGECLDIMGPYRAKFNSNSARYFIFSFAKLWEGKYSKLSYLKRKATGGYYSTSGYGWVEREMKSQRGKRFVDAYVAMFLAGRIDWSRLGRIYRADQKNPIKAAKYIIKQERVKKMIEERLKKEFSDRGITQGSVIDKYVHIYKTADDEKNPNLRVMKSVTDELRDMLDMMPKHESRGRGLLGEEVDAEWGELEDAANKAELGLGQKKLKVGQTEEE